MTTFIPFKDRIAVVSGFILYVVKRYAHDRASSIAAALAYTSLLSLVPLMAIALSMLAAFPVFSHLRAEIEGWVFTNFVPSVGQVLQDQVSNFISNAGRLSAAGIIGLAVTAIMLLVTIETAFNGIFRIDRPRSALSRLLVYWTMMTLGPLLIGASISVQGYLASLAFWDLPHHMSTRWAALLPTGLSILAFIVMFATIPNRQVLTKDAAVGGVVGGLLFAVLRWGFAFYVGHVGGYSSVYGAVAVVPIVLFWMFLSWVVVLIGAEITASLPEWRAGYAIHSASTTGERRLSICLEMLFVLRAMALEAGGGAKRQRLMAATTCTEPEFLGVIRRLIQKGYVSATDKGRYVLSRDLSTLPLAQLVHDLDLSLGLDDRVAPDAPWRARAIPLLALAHEGQRAALEAPLAEILEA